MKQLRSGLISLIIALIIHLFLLLLLYISWKQSDPVLRIVDDEAPYIGPVQGSGNAQVVMYQPPAVQSAPPQVVYAVDSTPLDPVDQQQPVLDVVDALQPKTVLQEPIEQIIPTDLLPTRDSAMPTAPVVPVHEGMAASAKKISRQRGHKRKMAIQKLKELSFGTSKDQHVTRVASARPAGAGDALDTQEIMREIYANKVIHTFVTAVNTDFLACDFEKDMIRRTTIYIKVRRDGTVLDLYFDPCPPELKTLEQATRQSGRSSGLYPCIPASLTADEQIVRLPVLVDGKRGVSVYHIAHKGWYS